MDGRIDSLTNQKIKDTAALAMRRQRQKQGRFVAEGVRLGEMAAASGWPLCYALYTAELASTPRGAQLLATLRQNGCSCYETSQQAFAKASVTATPQGILIVMGQRQQTLADLPEQERPFYLVLDGLQDPGNVGTIIRTADAAGADAVLCLRGTADIYEDKTVRATMGSLFHLPVVNGLTPEDLQNFVTTRGLQLYATALDSTAQPHFACDFTRGTAVVLGNEGNGVSPAVLALAQKCYIPMYGAAESLNAATAATIVTYEAVRQRHFA